MATREEVESDYYKFIASYVKANTGSYPDNTAFTLTDTGDGLGPRITTWNLGIREPDLTDLRALAKNTAEDDHKTELARRYTVTFEGRVLKRGLNTVLGAMFLPLINDVDFVALVKNEL